MFPRRSHVFNSVWSWKLLLKLSLVDFNHDFRRPHYSDSLPFENQLPDDWDENCWTSNKPLWINLRETLFKWGGADCGGRVGTSGYEGVCEGDGGGGIICHTYHSFWFDSTRPWFCLHGLWWVFIFVTRFMDPAVRLPSCFCLEGFVFQDVLRFHHNIWTHVVFVKEISFTVSEKRCVSEQHVYIRVIMRTRVYNIEICYLLLIYLCYQLFITY